MPEVIFMKHVKEMIMKRDLTQEEMQAYIYLTPEEQNNYIFPEDQLGDDRINILTNALICRYPYAKKIEVV